VNYDLIFRSGAIQPLALEPKLSRDIAVIYFFPSMDVEMVIWKNIKKKYIK
jgi:hypothetical protein